MERDSNLIVEQFKTDLIDAINHSNLPIAVVYYVAKDVFKDLEETYTNYVSKALKDEQAAQLQQNKEKPLNEDN